MRKGRQVAKHCVFHMFCGPRGSKSRLAKAAGFGSQSIKSTSASEQLEVQMSKKCYFGAKKKIQVNMLKAPRFRDTFGSSDVPVVYAIVARSTFRSQNLQSTSVSEHFWKLTGGKSSRGCVAKHVSKSNVLKLTVLGHFWRLRCQKRAQHCGGKRSGKSKW